MASEKRANEPQQALVTSLSVDEMVLIGLIFYVICPAVLVFNLTLRLLGTVQPHDFGYEVMPFVVQRYQKIQVVVIWGRVLEHLWTQF